MNFNNLQEYYTYLNKDNFFKDNIGLSSHLKSLQDKLISEVDKKHCNTEIFFNDFNFKNGIYVPLLSAGSNCYPDLNVFDDLDYLKQRASETVNNKYKAKYYHLLYHKTKDKREAIKAIESYLEFLINSNSGLKDNREIRGFIDAFDNLIHLVEKVKYDKKNHIIQFVKDLIQGNKVNDYCLYHIMDFVINNMKLASDTKQFFFDIIEAEITAIKCPEHREDFLKLIIDLAQKIGKPQQEFQNLLGDFYVDKADKEGKGFYVQNIYLKALNTYKKAGNKAKQDEVSKLMQDAKNTIKLNKVETKLANPFIDKYFKSLDKITTELTENYSSDVVYQYLILEKIFPKASTLDEFTKPQTLDFVTTITFDKNKNIDIGNSKGFNSYQMNFQLCSLEHLKQVFFKGQVNGKITFESLKDYIENNTWYKDVNTMSNPDGSDHSFKWIDFILPPLKLFFEQSEKDIKNSTHSSEGYIIAIDSLTLKFEGVLRDFSNKIGAQTIESDNTRTEQRVDFDKLFDNQKFISVLPEDDVAFFKFLFTRKGLNIRNNVAHCFYNPKDYSVSMVWLLICAYLKLGNFEFKVNTKDEQ